MPAQALQGLVGRWGAATLQALAWIWQLDADARRHPIAWPEQVVRQRLWQASLDTAVAEVGSEQVWVAWDAVCAVLGRAWRGEYVGR